MSLRLKLFLTYSLVVIVTLFTAALGSAVLVRQYADRLAMERLDDAARPISVQVAALIRGNVTLAELVENMQAQADASGMHILWSDADGNLLRQLVPQAEPALQFPEGALPHGVPQGTTGEIIDDAGADYFYSAYPLARAPAGIARAQTLILAVPRPEAAAALAGVFRPFAWAGVIALAASIVLAYWLSRSVYKPLGEVSAAADKIARGDYGYRINSRDTGDIGKLAQNFDRMAAEVEASQLKLRHFVADVSHELKSPLTAVQGFSQALLDGTAADQETRDKAARIINDEAKRLRRQVDELLDLSRLQSGQFKMDSIRIDLYDVLKHSADLFGPPAADKSVRIELDVKPGLWVKGDADRLEQVFNNLLDNAVKNSPPFTGIKIAARVEDGHVIASVLDHGPGIHPDALPRVFDRFYQVSGVRTGVGLGLAITREIVLAHGGGIEARSAPGAGAEFVVSLPSM
ncbi:HAMP domain-containing sensor histidine kinase [Dehalogenimonas sp. 4OHTPN]|uniref:histidine kinase n=1 Tax=Dehalogenimonas sp. 4OHTPN TaxID=3166643 RepID=A0AAU8GCB5_9CHLR